MSIRRRDLVQLGAGAGVGLLLSPVPWKLLDDTSIWSQNWSWLPKVPRGERTTKESRCTLCPGGCPVTAQCIAGVPVALKGTEAPLCTFGLGGHHLAYHPERLRLPSTSLEKAAAQMAAQAQKGIALVVDQRPGRAMSTLLGRFAAALPHGKYVALPSADGATGRAMERLAGVPLGFDWDRIETVVGIGTPVLDGWSAAAKARGKRVMQIEARQSATAIAAERWIPAKPGAEVAAALELAPSLSGSVLYIADGDPCAGGFDQDEVEAIAALNLSSARDALAPRRAVEPEAPQTSLKDVEPRSVHLLVLGDAGSGETFHWPAVERTLAPGALIVSFSPYSDELARRAHIRVPAAAAFEVVEDVPTPPYSKESSFAAAEPLHPAPIGGVDIAGFLRLVTPALEGSLDEIRKERAAAMEAGGLTARALKATQSAVRGVKTAEPPPLAVVAFGWRGTAGAGLSSPLITKLYQESGLRPGPALARVHPETARAAGLANRERVQIEAAGVTREKTVCFDSAVLPGIIEIADSALGRRWAPAVMRRLA